MISIHLLYIPAYSHSESQTYAGPHPTCLRADGNSKPWAGYQKGPRWDFNHFFFLKDFVGLVAFINSAERQETRAERVGEDTPQTCDRCRRTTASEQGPPALTTELPRGPNQKPSKCETTVLTMHCAVQLNSIQFNSYSVKDSLKVSRILVCQLARPLLCLYWI